MDSITLTIEQIKHLAEWAGLYVSIPEIIEPETELTILKNQDSAKAFYSEYPDEGCFKL